MGCNRVLASMSSETNETEEEAFCRRASQVIKDHKLADGMGLHPDLWRFIHFYQELVKAETLPLRRTSGT